MSVFAPSQPAQSDRPPTTSLAASLNSTPVPTSAPPSRAYEDLCKVVLQRRLRNLFGLVATASGVALYLAAFDPRALPGSLFSILPVLLFSPLTLCGAICIVVLRKKTLTTARPPLPTRFAAFAQLRHRRIALPVFLAYLASASFLHVAYVWTASWVSSEAQLGLFFFHQGRDAWQLNERRVLLAVFHVALAAAATVQHIVEDRSQVIFDEDATLAIPARLSARARQRLPSAVRSSVTVTVAFWSSYVVFRRPVVRFLLAHVLPVWTRSHLYSVMRYNGAYSLTLAARAFSSAMLFFLVAEAAYVCFEVYATQPMTVSQFASNPNQALLSGLRSSDPYFKSFAFLELSLLTLTDPKRREAIFKDVKPGSASGGAWAEISRECLLLVGTELQRAKGKGRLPSRSSAPASYSSSAQQEQPSPSRAPVRNENVFQPVRPSFFDKLALSASSSSSSDPAASGALGTSPAARKAVEAVKAAAAAPAAQEALSTAVSAASGAVARVPSILQSSTLVPTRVVDAARQVAKAGERAPAADELPQVYGFERRLALVVPRALRARMFDIGMEYDAGVCTPRRRESVWAVQALSNLICASLKEDPYGVTQRDIPKVLEALVRYLSVLDALADELQAQAERTLGGPEEREHARKVVEREVGEVQEALRAGAKAILTEFAEYLGEFRFPTQIAAKLQLLVDWGG
ncbi:hypothetical protein JCM10450v2_001772 [Rhodotorula kratochvilovae]